MAKQNKRRSQYWTRDEHMAYQKRVEENLKALQSNFDAISKTIQVHIEDEERRDKEMTGKLDTILHTMNNVQVNGRMGLNESLQDIYKKIADMKHEENKHLLNRPLKEILFTKSFVGKMIWIGLIYLVLSTVLHAFGIQGDLQTLGKVLFKM